MSIVIPCFNEGENVAALAARVREALADIRYELLFIDDSDDGTPGCLAALAAQDPCVRFEHRAGQRGLGTAVVRGFALAEGEILAVMDGDLQHPPELLPVLLAAIADGADVAVPSRFVPGGDDGGLSPRRKLVSWVARSLARLLVPAVRPILDPTGGYFMLRRRVITGIPLRPIGWKVLIEVLARGRYAHVVEVPYRFEARSAGESKLDWREHWNYLRHLAALAGEGAAGARPLATAGAREAHGDPL